MPAKSNQQTTTRQLQIAFASHGTLRQNLHAGQFSVLVELNPPGAEQPFKLALAPLHELLKQVNGDARLASVVLRERDAAEPCHPLADFQRALRDTCQKELITTLTGRGQTPEKLRETLAVLASAGASSVVLRTGGPAPDHPRDRQGQARPWAAGYRDSTRLLRQARAEYPNWFIGAGVNPFKYTVAETHGQYLKMFRKLNLGADFLVTQAGWDMRKLQELQWYLRRRGQDTALVARLLVVRPNQVPDILAGQWSGVLLSREFATQLQREAAVAENQALAVQHERLALQAAGCRLLGYSGIQLAGMQDATQLRMVTDKVFAALARYTTYAEWAKAWHEFHAGVEFAPHASSYFVFKTLLDPAHLDYDEAKTPLHPGTLPLPSPGRRRRYTLARALGVQKPDSLARRLLGGVLCGDGAPQWDLERTMMRAASACPKGLEDGPCGGTLADGHCELTRQPCFYHEVLALAQWQRQLDRLEGPAAPAAIGTPTPLPPTAPHGTR